MTGFKEQYESERARPKSFIARLGLGGGSNGNGAIYDNGINSASARLTPSEPQFLAAFGHSHGSFSLGQHPSHYSMQVVSAMNAAGVPLPAAHPIQRSFNLCAEGRQALATIRTNVVLPNVEPLNARRPSTQIAKPTSLATSNGTLPITRPLSALRHRSKQSPTNVSASSSEFSLSVTLAPPDREPNAEKKPSALATQSPTTPSVQPLPSNNGKHVASAPARSKPNIAPRRPTDNCYSASRSAHSAQRQAPSRMVERSYKKDIRKQREMDAEDRTPLRANLPVGHSTHQGRSSVAVKPKPPPEIVSAAAPSVEINHAGRPLGMRGVSVTAHERVNITCQDIASRATRTPVSATPGTAAPTRLNTGKIRSTIRQRRGRSPPPSGRGKTYKQELPPPPTAPTLDVNHCDVRLCETSKQNFPSPPTAPNLDVNHCDVTNVRLRALCGGESGAHAYARSSPDWASAAPIIGSARGETILRQPPSACTAAGRRAVVTGPGGRAPCAKPDDNETGGSKADAPMHAARAAAVSSSALCLPADTGNEAATAARRADGPQITETFEQQRKHYEDDALETSPRDNACLDMNVRRESAMRTMRTEDHDQEEASLLPAQHQYKQEQRQGRRRRAELHCEEAGRHGTGIAAVRGCTGQGRVVTREQQTNKERQLNFDTLAASVQRRDQNREGSAHTAYAEQTVQQPAAHQQCTTGNFPAAQARRQTTNRLSERFAGVAAWACTTAASRPEQELAETRHFDRASAAISVSTDRSGWNVGARAELEGLSWEIVNRPGPSASRKEVVAIRECRDVCDGMFQNESTQLVAQPPRPCRPLSPYMDSCEFDRQSVQALDDGRGDGMFAEYAAVERWLYAGACETASTSLAEDLDGTDSCNLDQVSDRTGKHCQNAHTVIDWACLLGQPADVARVNQKQRDDGDATVRAAPSVVDDQAPTASSGIQIPSGPPPPLRSRDSFSTLTPTLVTAPASPTALLALTYTVVESEQDLAISAPYRFDRSPASSISDGYFGENDPEGGQQQPPASPRTRIAQQYKAQLRASRLLDMPLTAPRHSMVLPQSMFDMMSQDDGHMQEVRTSQKLHRRVHSESTSSGSVASSSRPSLSPLPQSASNSSLVRNASQSFLSDLGCWMEVDEDDSTDPLSPDQQTMMKEISFMARSASTDSDPQASTKKTAAPPVPPRRVTRRVRPNAETTVAVPAGSVASAGSLSRLRKVPMYARLSHLPLSLVEPPSSVSWRARVGPKEYAELSTHFSNRELHRQEVIEELYTTEHNFIVSVTGILRTFSEPLRFSDYAFHDDVPTEVARLFQDLDDILSVHVKMFKALDVCVKSHPSALVVSLAEVLLPFVEELKVYQAYLMRYESVIRLLDNLATAADKASLAWFAETMERATAQPECRGMSFSSFLLKPVQRLMKYPLFFKQLIELMDASEHPDAEATARLQQTTEQLVRSLNTVKAREEDFEELKQLEARINGLPDGFCLASRHRKLLKQGSLRSVRLTEMERITLAERARCELPPSAGRNSFLLSSALPEAASLRRLSMTLSSPASSPRLSEHSSFASSDSASDCSNASSHLATAPSAASSLATSPSLSTSYFDLKQHVGDSKGEIFPESSPSLPTASIAAPVASKRKSVAGFLLRGSDAAMAAREVKQAAQQQPFDTTGSSEEEDVYAFLFDDVCLLTTRDPRAAKGRKKVQSRGKEQDTYTLLGFGSIARILAVTEWTNALTGHANLLEVEVMAVKSDMAQSARAAMAGTITFYFSFNEASASAASSPGQSPIMTSSSQRQCDAWHQAFERSFCGSIQSRKQAGIIEQRSHIRQQEWRRRERHVTDVVMNAAMAVDRVNLAALLQSGLPFPRSPSQQGLADLAFRTAARVESQGLDTHPTTKEHAGLVTSASLRTPSQRRTRTMSAAQTSGTAPLRARNVSSMGNLRRQPAFVVDDVPRIGDANAMNGIPSWQVAKYEEGQWWLMRLREIEEEAASQDEVEKMMEACKSRNSLPPSPLLSAVPSAMLSLESSNEAASRSATNLSRTLRMPKVRRGLPIVKVNSAHSLTA